ncbi:MAG TPA: gamma-glutamyltransferase family protein [Myxococcaceae bacterium]|nr:gamma-glutamyltransferase family protein [Myxococcaceae bacterium]
MAQHGVVTTSQPLAAQAGLEILRRGGNAVDAAVATAAVLNLVEPMNVGIAGDLFAFIYIASENRLHVLNASGKAPTGATLEHYNQLGFFWDPNNWGPGSGMPGAGIFSVTVPGAAWGWDEVVRRYGNLSLWEVMQPAIHYAENGFPVSERISNDWNLPNALPSGYPCCTERDPDSVATWYIKGQKPAVGQIFKNPDLARTFRLFAERGRDAFYRGAVAQAIVAKSARLGGTMTMADLRNYTGEWVEPVQTNYHGFDVFELPPPSQAWNTTEILNILEMCVSGWTNGKSLAELGPTNPEYWHLIAEAKKIAYWDQYKYNADPHFASVPLDRLTSKDYAGKQCAKVDPGRAGCLSADGYDICPKGNEPAKFNGDGDTIVLATADRWGNMVSWVNSNFAGFGSGITVPGYGFVLHNRGSLFTLDPKSPNIIEPQKRPYNTLSAGFVMQNGRPFMTITLMGGDMQAQGHAQTLVNIIDLGANIQAATDMARFHHNEVQNILQLESPLFNLVGDQLAAMGHNVASINGGGVGGYQAISVSGTPDDLSTFFYRVGSDHRKDGQAVGW